MNRPLTIGNRAPQIKMSEKDKMRPILAEIFSCVRGNDERGDQVKCRALSVER